MQLSHHLASFNQLLHVRRFKLDALTLRLESFEALQRAGQARLLGAGLNPESHLGLACEILARTLRPLPVSNP